MAMKWLIVAGVLTLLALAAFPAALDAWDSWVRHASIQSIHYVPRDINELSASRRRLPHGPYSRE